MPGLLEVLVLHEADAKRAEEGGADRLLVIGDLSGDGRSPEPRLVERIRAVSSLQVRPLVRLRDGYTTDGGEATRLIGLIGSYLEAGADGVAMGFLNGLGQIDAEVIDALTQDGLWPWTFDSAIDHALDADAADLKIKQAQVAQQESLVSKKTIRAPFAGRLGISSVNPGQYLNPGDKIVTLQALDSIYVDFYLPQQELSRVSSGQAVAAATDTYPDKKFNGKISAISPKVDSQTRNVQIEALIANPRHELLPGMYATIKVQAGKAKRYLTIPRTAVTFNPYGETVYIVEEKGATKDGKPSLFVRQTFVTLGPARGDQVAIIKGVKEGERIVSSGQLKLKSGNPVVINNQVQPASDADPVPAEP